MTKHRTTEIIELRILNYICDKGICTIGDLLYNHKINLNTGTLKAYITKLRRQKYILIYKRSENVGSYRTTRTVFVLTRKGFEYTKEK